MLMYEPPKAMNEVKSLWRRIGPAKFENFPDFDPNQHKTEYREWFDSRFDRHYGQVLKGTSTKHGIVREVLNRETLIIESFYRNGKIEGFSRQVDQDGY